MPHHTYADQELNRKYGIRQDYNHAEEEQIAKEMHVNPWKGYYERKDSTRPNAAWNIFVSMLSIVLGIFLALKYVDLLQ